MFQVLLQKGSNTLNCSPVHVLHLMTTLIVCIMTVSYPAEGTTDIVTLIQEDMQFIPLKNTGLPGFNSPMGLPRLAQGKYTSPKLLQGAKKLPVYALRYPGGTVANFFNWESQTLDEGMINKVGKKRMIQLIKTERDRNNGKLTRVDLESFFVANKTLGSMPFLVLNLLTSQTNSIIKTIDDIKAHNHESIYWELGNELSHDVYEEKYDIPGGWNVNIYINKASTIAAHIRKKYPKDKIGINVTDIVNGRALTGNKLSNVERKRRKWDLAVKSIESYDAVIIHPYVFLTKKNNMLLKRLTVKDSPVIMGNKLSDARWRWLFSSAQVIPDIYAERLSKRFPGKKIWLTEVGIAGDHGLKNDSGRLYRLLFNVAYFSSWMRYYPQVESYLYHGLFFGGGNSAVLYRDYSYTTNGLAFAFIGTALEDATEIATPVFSSSPTYRGIGPHKNVQIKMLSGLYTRGPTGDRLLIVNTGNQEITFQLPFKGVHMIEYGGDTHYITKQSEMTTLDDLPVHLVQDIKIKIKPFSVILLDTSKLTTTSARPK